MANGNNILEYIRWRGDLTLTADPFNNVDNLVLAELSYVDFDGIVSSSRDEKVLLTDVCEKYWQMHTEEEIRERPGFAKMSSFLLRPMAASKRFGSMKLCGYVNYVSKKTEGQMSAVQFDLGDGTTYVAFRGTDETLVGWKEDFNLSFMTRTEGQRLAVRYLDTNFGATSLRLRVGGHSKGGNFALYASAFTMQEVKRQIEQVYTNDGPGFRTEITETEEYAEVLKKTISIIPEDSVIGRILESGAKAIVIKSSSKGIMQHDALTWQVMGGRFVPGKRSSDSILFEKVFDDWINNVDDEARRQFVDQIFGVLMSSGADTMKQFRRSNLSELGEVLSVIRSMPKEQQKEMAKVMMQLVRSGEKNFYEQIEANGELPDAVRKWAAKRGAAMESREAATAAAASEAALSESDPIREAEKNGESVSYG